MPEPTATGPNGEKIVFRGGRWQPLTAGAPQAAPQQRAPINTGTDPRIDIARSAEQRNQAEFGLKLQDRDIKQQDRAKQAEAEARAIEDARFQLQNVIGAAKEAKKLSDNFFATGFGANIAREIGGTSAADVQALLNTIGSNTAFDRLQKMREESPTGGALGAVSEIELRLLRDSIASLEQSQSDVQFRKNMDKVIESYSRVLERLGGPASNKPARRSNPDDDALIRKYLD